IAVEPEVGRDHRGVDPAIPGMVADRRVEQVLLLKHVIEATRQPELEAALGPRRRLPGPGSIATGDPDRDRAIGLLDQISAPGHPVELARALDEPGEILLYAKVVEPGPDPDSRVVALAAAILR